MYSSVSYMPHEVAELICGLMLTTPLLPYRTNEKDARRLRPLDRRLVPVKKLATWAAEHKNELLDSLKKADAAQCQSA